MCRGHQGSGGVEGDFNGANGQSLFTKSTKSGLLEVHLLSIPTWMCMLLLLLNSKMGAHVLLVSPVSSHFYSPQRMAVSAAVRHLSQPKLPSSAMGGSSRVWCT